MPQIRDFSPAIVLIISLALGYQVAGQVNRLLGISLEPRSVIEEVFSTESEADSSEVDVQLARSPAFNLRLVETGGVGVPALVGDYEGGDDYSHHSGAFKDVVLVDAPYIDEENFARAEGEFRDFVQRMIAYGYNGIVINGFLEYINFDGVEDGMAIYGPESDYRSRHVALRDRFGELFEYASDMGMKVILRTDMLALTGPLEAYFEREMGSIDASNPALWQTYETGFAELFEAWPFVDGIMIRIGEAGHFANLPGWDYYSGLHVTTDEAVRTMLVHLGQVTLEWDKEIFFRTWSVGVGEVGDMHTNPDTYMRVLGELDLPNLIVSTKYAAGDYYSHLPVNPTLKSGNHRRIVEVQARREFEGMGAIFNDTGPLHQAALQEIIAGNDKIEGIWTWTQEGGPIRTGPMIIYPFYGFWQPTDLNVYSAGQLALNPGADLGRVNADWVRQTFSEDPETIDKLSEMISLSRKTITEGLYIGEFAKWQVRALGLEPPPMMWIFEWDMVSGASSVLSMVYYASRDELEAAIAGGDNAVARARQMQELVAGTDPGTYHEPILLERLSASLAYQVSLLETLAAHRRAFLLHYDWLATGNEASYRAWQDSVGHFTAALEEHRAHYGSDLANPAYDFTAAEVGMAHAHNGPAASWLARVLLVIMGLMLLGGVAGIQRRLSFEPGKVGLRALLLGILKPWQVDCPSFPLASDELVVSAAPLLIVITGWLAFSSGLSGVFVLLMAGALVIFLVTLLFLNRGASCWPLWAAIMGVSLLTTALPTAIVAVRGPLYFWYRFWTDPAFNSVYITLAVVAFGWSTFVVYQALRNACGRSAAASIGQIMIGAGVTLLVIGGVTAMISLETALTMLNNELAVLPLGLSKILGITVHLGIPTQLPAVVAIGGLVLLGAGTGLRFVAR